MAISDFPKVPGELQKRIGELTKKMKDAEISQDDVIQNAVAAIGKTRIDNNGIRTFGNFGEIVFDSDDLKALIESGSKGIELLFILNGKEFYVKAGSKIEKIKVGFPPGPKEVSEIPEEDEEEVPIVEFKPDKDGNYPENRVQIVLDFFKKRFVDRVPVREPGFVIHNYEAFAGFIKDWKDFSLLLEAPVALLELTTKKKIMRTGESAYMLLGDILTRCGV